MMMTNHIVTLLNPKTLVYSNNILRPLVVTSITILMHSFLGVCRLILVFHRVKNNVLHFIFVYFVEVSQV